MLLFFNKERMHRIKEDNKEKVTITKRLIVETANEGVSFANYLFCSCQEVKIRNVARKLNMFEEHFLWGLFVHFNGFFRTFLVEHITILPESRISLQNTSKFYQGSLEIRTIGLISQIFSQNTSLSVKQTEVC